MPEITDIIAINIDNIAIDDGELEIDRAVADGIINIEVTNNKPTIFIETTTVNIIKKTKIS